MDYNFNGLLNLINNYYLKQIKNFANAKKNHKYFSARDAKASRNFVFSSSVPTVILI